VCEDDGARFSGKGERSVYFFERNVFCLGVLSISVFLEKNVTPFIRLAEDPNGRTDHIMFTELDPTT
jgi:hypothetical protein